LIACATFTACSGDDNSGAVSDGGGAADTSQGSDTGAADATPAADAGTDAAASDGAVVDAIADAIADSAPTDSSAADTSTADANDAGDAAPSSVVACPNGTTPTATISVGAGQSGLTFAPTSVTIHVGDTVQWTWATDGHSVTSVGDSTSCVADGTFCSPDDTNCSAGMTSGTGTTYCQQFTAAGTFNFVCIPHCSFGMRGSVIVQ
jgi:plastocyanin